jgi:hypothetical protein
MIRAASGGLPGVLALGAAPGRSRDDQQAAWSGAPDLEPQPVQGAAPGGDPCLVQAAQRLTGSRGRRITCSGPHVMCERGPTGDAGA